MKGLYRSSLAELNAWASRARRKPLVIRGARQVGKSTLVRQLADTRGFRLLEVNLEQHRGLERVFADLDVPRILLELEAVGRVAPGPGTLLFLDEIQSTPSALAALRYLWEQRPDLPVVAAGSLLEAVLRSHDFAMPVGRVEYLHLGPMTLTEFLRGVGDDDLVELCDRWETGDPWPDEAHHRLAARQREFLLVGGMPEAVAAFAGGEGIESVRRVQRSIVSTYRDDFAKYGSTPDSLVRLQRVFDWVPGAVGQKVKYTNISRDDRARELRQALDLLALARVIWRVHHSACSGVPLEAALDAHTYKCLFLDVGLASHMTGVDWSSLGSWDDRKLVHEGGLAEQFIGQHLLFRKRGLEAPLLCYWLREGRSANAEVDFVIDHRRRIVPVEVKAGTAGSLRSLHQFLDRELKGDRPIALRFDLNPPSVGDFEHRMSDGRQVRYRVLSLPLYMVEHAERLLEVAASDS
jgi:hypothetical protein